MQTKESEAVQQDPPIYKAHTERIGISTMVLATLTFTLTSWNEPVFRYVFTTLTLYHIFLLFIRYSFSIKGSKLIYRIFFIKWRIRTKELDHTDISQIYFRRENWAAKSAIIKTYKGHSPRLYKFDGKDLFHRLEDYCYEYRIPLKKSKDYLILADKYDKQNKLPESEK